MSAVEVRNPYVGPRPFELQDKNLFFGRDREANEVVSLIIAHLALVLYAPSGAGKTSLISAGVVPRLEEEGFEVLPLVRVRGLIPEEIPRDEISNLYIFNTLMNWAKEETDPRLLMQMSLADFLQEREHPTDEDGLALPRVIILDQFEELFTVYPERWRDREGFFRQVREALEADPLLRVVFVIREDYIAELDPYVDLLPERLRTRFRLERLGKEVALLAVTGPLRDTKRTFAQGVAESLIEDLLKVRVQVTTDETAEVTGEFIEPVQLQVVCESLWRELPIGVSVITQSHLRTFGDVSQALSRFYESSIRAAATEAHVKQRKLRLWFEHTMITSAGTRGMVFRGREETGGITNAAVDVLENLHLIRGEWRAGSRWYELTHDRFIEPIKDSNQIQRRQQRQRGARLNRAIIYVMAVALLALASYVVFNFLTVRSIELPPTMSENWSFTTGSGIRHSSPDIGADGTIYIGSLDGKLYAINPDGTEKWHFPTRDQIKSSPVIGDDGTIYVGSYDRKLYAINPDGTEKWNFPTSDDIYSSPAIGADGTIYIGSCDGWLYAINPDGTRKWRFTTGDFIYSSPAIGDDSTIYIGSCDHKLYAINPDGTEKWNFPTSYWIYSSPNIGADGTIYVGSCDRNLYAINPDGTEKWHFPTGNHIYSSPNIGADGTIYIGSYDNKLYAINPVGTVKWSFTTDGCIDSSPAIGDDGTIYIGSYDGKLYATGEAIPSQ